MQQKVVVRDLAQVLGLEVMTTREQLNREVRVADFHRPGLELAGYFTYHPVDRLQLLGKTELSFLQGLDADEKWERLLQLCHPDTPCIIITRQLEVPAELMKIATDQGVPILRTKLSTTKFGSKLTNYLERMLAPTTTVHGVLVDVYGIGLILMGNSGIGKSETALELVKRGHRLVADDAVEIQQTEEGQLVGHAPELIRYLLEIRGLGIINVMTLFGAGAVRDKKKISLVIQLETWKKEQQYDRLGLDEEKVQIIDTELTKLTIPVRPGRNLAVIIEVAAMNFRLKKIGYDAAQQFVNQLSEKIDIADDLD
ncbi:HPr kinase/phosphorylase [Hazenella sp. IB182357]|uniref:HPr kinase/phosphorylase n=1 Tax=Polycladospora coralii TaxID=2771432 RepID=A0A926RX62_9BACL|nr:HPr(Ser) kinase/phosphatase [Polycladospora coralii]MBD1372226.1 HPr kinase/phosphorylase [Polycladospora coralii]MBS7530725.1 HPr kinase/phosphorylase [Polycladospora coralii]